VTALWIAVAVLGVGIVFTALALAGAVRRIDELRKEMNALASATSEIEHPASGLPVGSSAPAFEADRLDGERFASSELEGRKHLVVFAEPGCAACHVLVPDLVRAATLPPTVVSLGRGSEPWPDDWHPPAGADIAVVRDPDGTVAEAFHAGFTPHVFVIDEGGAVSAQGPADSLDAVRTLLREADAIQIVMTESADG
jgi:hypothetical protein